MQLIRADQTLSLLLRDHGPGIAAELRDRVMLPFERANDSVDGAGLGLAIVQEIVSNQRATLSLEAPEEGCGLLVRVVFSVT
jgi:two-component system sensor histidine kinase TctE